MPMKYLWPVLPLALGILAFFDFIPTNWTGTRALIENVDNWLSANAKYPALFALAVGIVLGTTIIPEVWASYRNHFWPPKEEGDYPAAEAFNDALYRSKWAKQRAKNWENLPAVPYETGLSQAEVIEKRLRQALNRTLHDELRAAQLVAFGRGGATNTMREIPRQEWDQILMDFGDRKLNSTLVSGGPPNVCIWFKDAPSIGSSRIAYTHAHFSKRQFLAKYSRAWLPRSRTPA